MRNEIRQRVAEAAERRHASADDAADDGSASAGERAVIGKRLGEGHRDARADRGGEPHHESLPGVVGREGGGEERRERRNRAVHQARKARLHILQDEHAARDIVLFFAGLRRQDFLAEILRDLLVLIFGFREVEQQFAYRSVARRFRRFAVKIRGFVFHIGGVFPDLFEAERTNEPDGAVTDESAYVLAADEGQGLAEFLAVQIEQLAAVGGFLRRHLFENLGRGRVLLAQAVRKGQIDASVFFFVADGEGENFLFGKIGKSFHGWLSFGWLNRPFRVLNAVRGESNSVLVLKEPE